MKNLNLGIVGCGAIAHERHIPAFLRASKSVKLCAVCDINTDLARKTATKFNISKAYSSIDEMISKENLDVIDICTPPITHASLAEKAMNNSSNVLLEKPMALSVSDCEKMIIAADQNNVKLSIIHNNLFNPGFMKLKKLAEKGNIGEVLGMRIYWTTPPEEMLIHENHWAHKLPGGLIGETGPHLVYLSLAFLKEVNAVSVFKQNHLRYPWALYDNLNIFLNGNNMICSIQLSYTNFSHIVWIDLFGSNGILHLDLIKRIVTYHKCKDLSPSCVAFSTLSNIYQTTLGLIGNTAKTIFKLDRAGKGHQIAIESFIRSILYNEPAPVSPEEGRETTKVMEMIVEEINRGK